MDQVETVRLAHDTAWSSKSSAITSDQSNPTLTDGSACVGYSEYHVKITDLHAQTTNYDVTIWVSDTAAGTDWMVAQTFSNCGAVGRVLTWPLHGEFARVVYKITNLTGATKSLKAATRLI
jgi:hypothetical protein